MAAGLKARPKELGQALRVNLVRLKVALFALAGRQREQVHADEDQRASEALIAPAPCAWSQVIEPRHAISGEDAIDIRP